MTTNKTPSQNPDQRPFYPSPVSVNQVAGGEILEHIAKVYLNHPDLKDRPAFLGPNPVGRSTLYKMSSAGFRPSPANLVKLVEDFDRLGLDPWQNYGSTWQPLPVPEAHHFNLIDEIADALTTWFSSVEPQPAGPNPMLTHALDYWLPVILKCQDSEGRPLLERIPFPISPLFPSHDQLHRMGVWERGVSPYDYLVSNPESVLRLAQALRKIYSDRLKYGDNHWHPMASIFPSSDIGRGAAATLYAMKQQAIGSDFLPKGGLAELAAKTAAISIGATDNPIWDSALMMLRANKEEPIQRLGMFDVNLLSDTFHKRLQKSIAPCAVRATFTPQLADMYEQTVAANSQYQSSGKLYGEPDPTVMGNLLVTSVASQMTLKWTASQLLSLALYYHVPVHAFLIWLMEAGVLYRRQFISDSMLDRLVQDVISYTAGLDGNEYRRRFVEPYKAAMKNVTPSTERRYNTMKEYAKQMLDAQALASPEDLSAVPGAALEAFYEALVGCTNEFATDPSVRSPLHSGPAPSALYSASDDEDDDEPAVSIFEALADDDDDDDDFFIPEASTRVKLPTAPTPQAEFHAQSASQSQPTTVTETTDD